MSVELPKSESVNSMWQAYLRSIGEDPETTRKTYMAWHFCDNEADANELAELVRRGPKRATTGSLWAYEAEQEPVPKVGDLSVIIDWEGQARCIIRTSQIDIVPLEDVTEEFAWTEGEGDRSLEYWRNAHWAFFSREMKDIGRIPDWSMPVVCERFDVVFGGES